MHQGHETATWNHTTHIMALIANIHRDSKKQSKPFSPSDFLPVDQTKTPKKKVYDKEMFFGEMKRLVKGTKP